MPDQVVFQGGSGIAPSIQGLRVAEVSPAPVAGDWWAILSPLSLARVIIPGECSQFEQWNPNGKEDNCIYVGTPNGRRLWFSYSIPREWLPVEDTLTEGAILIETETQRLVFIGPDEQSECVLLLADWECLEFRNLRLFQRGIPEPELDETSRMSKVAEGVDPLGATSLR